MRRWAGNVALMLAVIFVCGFVWRDNDAQRQDARLAVATADYQSCLRLETVKAEFRREAWKSWRDLDQTLKLLHLKRTPEIVKVARDSRDRKLARFHRFDCRELPTQSLTD